VNRSLPLTFALFLVCGPWAWAQSAFELKAREHDSIRVAGLEEPLEGTIEALDEEAVQFRTVSGIRYVWQRDEVIEIRRRCTLADAYGQAVVRAGRDPSARVRLAEACLEADLRDEAIAELRTAARLDAAHLPAYGKLLELAQAAGDVDLELWTLNAASRGGVATRAMRARHAAIYVELDLLEDAEAVLEKAVEADRFDTLAESRLALLELVRGRPEQAAWRLRVLLDAKPNHPDGLVALGFLELARDRADKAQEAFVKAAARAESPAALTCLAAIEVNRGRPDRAAAYYGRARAARPDLGTAVAGEALLAAGRGNIQDAIELLSELADGDPDDVPVLRVRAYVSELQGQHDAALRLYEKVLTSARTDAAAWTGAARCLERLGDRAKAVEQAERAVLFDPDYLPARRVLGRLIVSEHPARAAEHLARVAGSDAAAADDHAALGSALLRLGRFAEATAAFQEAGRANVHGRIGLGFIAYAEGRTDGALEHLAAAARLGDHHGYATAAIEAIHAAQEE